MIPKHPRPAWHFRLTFEELKSFADAQRLKEKDTAQLDGVFPSPEPVQLKVRRGDVVLAHPLLPHAAGWNFRDPRGKPPPPIPPPLAAAASFPFRLLR